MRRLVTDDFEMFHDKSGRSITSGAQFVKITQEMPATAGGHDFLSTRELVTDGQGFSAQQLRRNRDGYTSLLRDAKGKPNRLTETAQFTHVWKEENGQWRLARALSYDHQLAEPPP